MRDILGKGVQRHVFEPCFASQTSFPHEELKALSVGTTIKGVIMNCAVRAEKELATVDSQKECCCD